jgi:hypothetical protein
MCILTFEMDALPNHNISFYNKTITINISKWPTIHCLPVGRRENIAKGKSFADWHAF